MCTDAPVTSRRFRRMPPSSENGARKPSSIEPESLSKVFDELKDWEVCLRADPAIAQKLLVIDEKRRTDPSAQKIKKRPTLTRGPSL